MAEDRRKYITPEQLKKKASHYKPGDRVIVPSALTGFGRAMQADVGEAYPNFLVIRLPNTVRVCIHNSDVWRLQRPDETIPSLVGEGESDMEALEGVFL